MVRGRPCPPAVRRTPLGARASRPPAAPHPPGCAGVPEYATVHRKETTQPPGCAGVPARIQRCAPSQAYRGRFLGKPLRAIFRFRHQDVQPPPSPRVGDGGRGDEGQKARECSTPRIAPKNATLESHHRSAGTTPYPFSQRLGARASRPHTALRPITGLQREVFGEAPACHLPFQASERPTSPFSPCGRRGQGG